MGTSKTPLKNRTMDPHPEFFWQQWRKMSLEEKNNSSSKSDRRKCPAQKVQSLWLHIFKKRKKNKNKKKKRKKNARQGGSPAYKLKPHLAIWQFVEGGIFTFVWRLGGQGKKEVRLLQPLNCQSSLAITHSHISRVIHTPVSPHWSLHDRNKYSRGSSFHLGTGYPKGLVLITNGVSHLTLKCNHSSSRGKTLKAVKVASASGAYPDDTASFQILCD